MHKRSNSQYVKATLTSRLKCKSWGLKFTKRVFFFCSCFPHNARKEFALDRQILQLQAQLIYCEWSNICTCISKYQIDSTLILTHLTKAKLILSLVKFMYSEITVILIKWSDTYVGKVFLTAFLDFQIETYLM